MGDCVHRFKFYRFSSINVISHFLVYYSVGYCLCTLLRIQLKSRLFRMIYYPLMLFPYPVLLALLLTKLRVGGSQIKVSICTENVFPQESINLSTIIWHKLVIRELRNIFALFGFAAVKHTVTLKGGELFHFQSSAW